jgi:RNA polymerase sigma factor (sigma-70 family)
MADRDTTAELDRRLAEVLPLVKAVLRRKSGMSLAEDDARPDNVDAVEVYHDVLARVWERLRAAAPSDALVADIRGYAAAVAHNAWSDYLRDKYPRRASLKNRLRYFLTHQPRYAVWQNADGESLGGLRRWQLSGQAATANGLASLRDGTRKLPPGSLPQRANEHYAAEDWDRLLSALFAAIGGPAPLDDLVAAIARLVGLQEERTDSLDDDDEERAEIADDTQPSPEDIAEARSSLARLWAAVLRLKPDHRCAYLLNIPGPGKSRGDIEVFVLHGIASVRDIGAGLCLDERQYAIAWTLLELNEPDRAAVAALRSPEEKFELLWKYLPLADTAIARLLGLARQQVINRRMLALRELARMLSAGPA